MERESKGWESGAAEASTPNAHPHHCRAHSPRQRDASATTWWVEEAMQFQIVCQVSWGFYLLQPSCVVRRMSNAGGGASPGGGSPSAAGVCTSPRDESARVASFMSTRAAAAESSSSDDPSLAAELESAQTARRERKAGEAVTDRRVSESIAHAHSLASQNKMMDAVAALTESIAAYDQAKTKCTTVHSSFSPTCPTPLSPPSMSPPCVPLAERTSSRSARIPLRAHGALPGVSSRRPAHPDDPTRRTHRYTPSLNPSLNPSLTPP